jgi:hypothetical protein
MALRFQIEGHAFTWSGSRNPKKRSSQGAMLLGPVTERLGFHDLRSAM